MTTAIQPAGGGGGLERPSPTGLADVIDTILDKGLVIDAYVRVSLVGIEILTIDARVVVASVETYLKFADAANRLDITDDEKKGLPDLVEDVGSGAAKMKTKGAIEAAADALRDVLVGGERPQRQRPSRREAGR
jgi:gas vesicle structural protein